MLELEETLSGFFWVLGKDHLPKLLEFYEQFLVGKSEAKVKQQCSLGVVAQFSGGGCYWGGWICLYSSPGACSLPCESPAKPLLLPYMSLKQ